MLAGEKFSPFQPVGEIPQPFHRAGRLLQTIEREVELLAVRNTGQSKPESRRLVTLRKQITEREEIPLRLRHLLAFDKQMLGVQPVPRERLARRTLALRNFVFVVRKCQVDSTGVNIQCLAEIFHGHRGTLNVPAGSPRAERCVPEMLPRFRRFPQRKIPRTLFFVAIVVDARARLNARQIDFRQLSVLGEFRDAVINRTFARIRE